MPSRALPTSSIAASPESSKLSRNTESLEQLRNGTELKKYLDTLRENSRAATSAGNRLTDIVERLKVLSQRDESPLARLNLHEALDSILTLIRHHTSGRVRIIKDYGELPLIRCYPMQLNHAFMSLLLNASQAIEGAGEIRITTWTDDDSIFARIHDSGKGIPTGKTKKPFRDRIHEHVGHGGWTPSPRLQRDPPLEALTRLAHQAISIERTCPMKRGDLYTSYSDV